jgi:hypothetical protein
MKQKKFRLFLLLLFVIFSWSCNRHPADVPELFDCRVTVKNGSVPIQGATVTLGLEEGSSMWSSGGVTDSSGFAVIKTMRLDWQGQGVPAGKYIVTIFKLPDVSSLPKRPKTESQGELDRYKKEFEAKYKALPLEVPEKFGDFGTSPFRITVKSGETNTLDIDVSKNITD